MKILSFTAFIFSVSFIFQACKKDAVGKIDCTTESSVQSDDQSRFSNETDAVVNDANATLEVTAGFNGRGTQVQSVICDATIAVDTISNPRTVTITYNGF